MSPDAAATSLSVTLAHAIAYLTRALVSSYPATTIIKLQLALEANLIAQYASTWTPSDPLRGSGRRCLTLSPTSAPPRSIHDACVSARVDWSEWIRLLGNVEFDMFIDPGSISVRFGNWGAGKVGKFFTVWSQDTIAHSKAAPSKSKLPALTIANDRTSLSKTLTQQLLEDDSQEENELFAMIADELREPTWITPILTQFPAVPSHHSASDSDRSSPISRSSSRASSSSGSALSLFSSPESVDSASSFASDNKAKISRRERARQAKVFIDTSKNEVTNYDGGKTTVLTGGVMLGASMSSSTASSHRRSLSSTVTSSPSVSDKKSRHAHSSSSSSWRATPRV